MGLVKESRIFASDVNRLPDAYPVYSKDYKAASEVMLSYLHQFKNLWTLGRGGGFFYGHVHDFVTDGFSTAQAVDNYVKRGTKLIIA
jgi:protoporphyrinogen oxidase